jgi:hypothetical protein
LASARTAANNITITSNEQRPMAFRLSKGRASRRGALIY